MISYINKLTLTAILIVVFGTYMNSPDAGSAQFITAMLMGVGRGLQGGGCPLLEFEIFQYLQLKTTKCL